MATHPFAIKLEEAIEKAKRLRDAMLRSKVAGEDDPSVPKPSRGPRGSGRVVDLGIIGLGGGVEIEEGGATHIYSMVPSPGMAKLLQELANEERKCHAAQTIVQHAGRFEVIDGKQVWTGSSASVVGRSPCPGVRRVQRAIANFRGQRYILKMRG